MMPTLHVIIPVYNEDSTLKTCLDRVLMAALPDGFERSLIIVDDGSLPNVRTCIRILAEQLREAGTSVQLLEHEVNRGKGAALQTAFDHLLSGSAADDDLVIIQDADLEYDPADYANLMAPLLADTADAVIGTRWDMRQRTPGLRRAVHRLGNAMLTGLSNRLHGTSLTDMECCYKLMRINTLRQVRPGLSELRFGIEPQIVCELVRAGARLSEVHVSYVPRGLHEGKKIGMIDACKAILVILRDRPDLPHDDSNLLGGRKVLLQFLGFIIGSCLLWWCISSALHQSDWSNLRNAQPMLILGMLGCSLISGIVNGAAFWHSLRRIRALGFLDMQWLNFIGTGMNFAPIRLGMLLRTAWHMKINRLPLLHIGGWYTILVGSYALIALTGMLALLARDTIDAGWWVLSGLLLVLGAVLVRWAARRPVAARLSGGLHVILADTDTLAVMLGLRIIDFAAFTARMAIALSILGIVMVPSHIMIISMVAIVTSLNPLGRIGFREFFVALAAGWLHGSEGDIQHNMNQVALLDSAAEAMVFVPMGIACLWWFARSWKGPTSVQPAAE